MKILRTWWVAQGIQTQEWAFEVVLIQSRYGVRSYMDVTALWPMVSEAKWYHHTFGSGGVEVRQESISRALSTSEVESIDAWIFRPLIEAFWSRTAELLLSFLFIPNLNTRGFPNIYRFQIYLVCSQCTRCWIYHKVLGIIHEGLNFHRYTMDMSTG